jgi:GH35 family endo-1,4-beta-xylanase
VKTVSTGARRVPLWLHAAAALRVTAALSPAGAAQGEDTGDDWMQRASQRIEHYRKTDVRLEVRDPQGRALNGAQVRLTMARQAFPWGVCLNAPYLAREGRTNDYARVIPELFNTVVLENGHKWSLWENMARREMTGQAERWVSERGLRLRGHAMIWQTLRNGPPVPADVVSRLADRNPGNQAYVAQRAREHVATIGAHFRDRVYEWDVVNEQVPEHALTQFLAPDAEPWEAPELVTWFQTARRASPGARLCLNDYHILVGDFTKHKDRYARTIAYLLGQGAPLQAIGMQCHFHGGNTTRTPDELRRTLDRFAVFGLPIVITEFDMFGKGWGDSPQAREARQADFLRDFLQVVYSHPAVDGVLFWGFWDGCHWKQEAPFYRADWSAKPALDVYRELVLARWWSDEATVCDADGLARARVFPGDFRVEVTYQGHTHTVRLPLRPDMPAIRLTWQPPRQ